MAGGIIGDANVRGRVRRADELRGGLELRWGGERRENIAGEDVRAPLLVRTPQRLGIFARVRDLCLEDDRLALPASFTERFDHGSELLRRLTDSQQAVRPRGAPAGCRRGDGRDKEAYRLDGSSVEARIDHGHQTAMRDRLALPQGAHDVDALAETRVAFGLRRPRGSSDVLVERFAAADGQPEPAGEHLTEGRGRLGDDRG